MELTEALLDSWDRQCRIVNDVAMRVDDSNRGAKPSPDGRPLDHQLAHIHRVRQEWLSFVSPVHAEGLGSVFVMDRVTPIADLDEIRAQLKASGEAIREAMRERLAGDGGPIVSGNVTYDHPVLFLQHMVWHEGWHVGLILLGLRLAGQEPSEEWEEANVWGQWRTEVWA